MDEFNNELTPSEAVTQDTPAQGPTPAADISGEPASPQKPRLTYYLLIGIFACVFLLCAVYLGHYFWENHQASSKYEDLASLRESLLGNTTEPTLSTSPSTAPDSSEEGSDQPDETTETTEPTMLPEMEALYQLNNDLVGWITMIPIPGTSKYRIDYPVMQTPSDPDYYLRRDFYGNDSVAGCLYARAYCDVFTPSDNVVIYGHHMKTGDMFGLLYWYQKYSYWQTHQTFTFDTLYEHHTYQIFAVFKTSGTYGVGYPYHLFTNASSEEEFDQFIADVKGAAFTSGKYVGSSLYDTGITPKYGDKILTLSTCEYSVRDPDGEKNGRLVVMAVQID